MWEEFHEGKQTYSQLAAKYDCSIKTIQRRLDKVSIIPVPKAVRPVVVLMDTRYFGRSFGVMLFKDSYTGENLHKAYVKHVTNKLYADGITHLQQNGFEIKAIVCNCRKGLLSLYSHIPMQMCQFHQTAIITRYLTRKPKLAAAQELRELVLMLTKTDKESFTGALATWHSKWKEFLNERTLDEHTKKGRYTHRRLRSAYRSLVTNIPRLFI